MGAPFAVEPLFRFVEDKERRGTNQREDEPRELELTCGQLMGEAFGQVWDAHTFEPLIGEQSGRPRACRRCSPRQGDEPQLFADGEVTREGRQSDHPRHCSAECRRPLVGDAPLDVDRSGRRCRKSAQQREECGLAGAVASGHRKRVSRMRDSRNRCEEDSPVDRHRHVVEADDRVTRAGKRCHAASLSGLTARLSGGTASSRCHRFRGGGVRGRRDGGGQPTFVSQRTGAPSPA